MPYSGEIELKGPEPNGDLLFFSSETVSPFVGPGSFCVAEDVELRLGLTNPVPKRLHHS